MQGVTRSDGGAPLTQPAPSARAGVGVVPTCPPAPARQRGERASEKDCQQTIVEAARMLGYRILAIRPGQSRHGRWSSPIQGDAGYPDLTLAHPVAGIMFVELKRWPNKLEADQARWAEALVRAGAVWRLVWVPEQLDEFVTELAYRAMRRTQ